MNIFAESHDSISAIDITPAEVFAVGMVEPQKNTYSTPSFWTLIKNLGKMERSQRLRFWRQICSLLLAEVVVLALAGSRPKPNVSNALIMANISVFCLMTAQTVVGAYYEVFAPDIASGRVNWVKMTFCWVVLQIPIFMYPLKLIIFGGIGAKALILQIQVSVRNAIFT